MLVTAVVHDEVRLQLHALVCNLATFLRCIELTESTVAG